MTPETLTAGATLVAAVGAAIGGIVGSWLQSRRAVVDDNSKFRSELMGDNRLLRAEMERLSDDLATERLARVTAESDCARKLVEHEKRIAVLEERLRSAGLPTNGQGHEKLKGD